MSFYMQKIKDNYYFRTRIPQDLQHHFPFLEIKRSLRTKDIKHAKCLARLWSSRAENVFVTLRSNVLTPEQVQGYIRRELPSTWHKCKKGNQPSHLHIQKDDQQRKAKRLQQVSESYIQEHVTLGKWTEKTIVEVRSQLALFQKIVGNPVVKSIDRQMMISYLEALKRLPSGMSIKPEYRHKTPEQILLMPNVEPMSNTTVNKYIDRAGALLIWCMKQEFIDRNPASGLSIAKTTKDDELRAAYSREDVSGVLKSLSVCVIDKPERYWVPRIAMCSGMRMNEICQLYVSDVVNTDGVWCFDINDEGDKRLKNLASKRMIPVHPKLIEIGILDYVESLKQRGAVRLWENLPAGRDGYSHLFSKWYQRHNRLYITQDKKKCFHSFRHTVADTLKQEGVAEGVIAEILGHANQSITTGRYGKRYRPQVLLEALMKLSY